MTISLFRETKIIYEGASEPVKLYKFTPTATGTYETSELWTPLPNNMFYLAGVWYLDDTANTFQFADSLASNSASIDAADEYPELPLTAYQPWSDKIGGGVLPIVAQYKLWLKSSASTTLLIAGFMSTQLKVE